MAYVDWSQQEFGIAAALSGDAAMMDAYRSGDPYLAFGKQAGQIPADGTKADPRGRAGAVQGVRPGRPVRHGAGGAGPADRQAGGLRPGAAPAPSGDLPDVLAWSDGAESSRHAPGPAPYRVRLDGPRRRRRQPAVAPELPVPGQRGRDAPAGLLPGDGAGHPVVAPVHDALLVEGPADAIDEVVAQTQEAMAEASEVVLDGFRLRSDAKVVRWPDRYMDDRGREFWGRSHAVALRDSGGRQLPVHPPHPNRGALMVRTEVVATAAGS